MAGEALQAASSLAGQMGAQTEKAIPTGYEAAQINLASPGEFGVRFCNKRSFPFVIEHDAVHYQIEDRANFLESARQIAGIGGQSAN